MNKEYSIMIDEENFQQRPMWTNCKQLGQLDKKIGQCSLKCHNHSPVFITNFSHSDQNLRLRLSPNIVLSLSSSKKE